VVSFFGCKILGFTTAQSGQTFGTFKSEGGGEWGNPALTIQPPSPPHRVSARARSVAIPLRRLVVSQLNRFLYVYECASHASRVYQGATSTGTRQFIEELAEVPPPLPPTAGRMASLPPPGFLLFSIIPRICPMLSVRRCIPLRPFPL